MVLLGAKTNDSVELAVTALKEAGALLQDSEPQMLRMCVLHLKLLTCSIPALLFAELRSGGTILYKEGPLQACHTSCRGSVAKITSPATRSVMQMQCHEG